MAHIFIIDSNVHFFFFLINIRTRVQTRKQKNAAPSHAYTTTRSNSRYTDEAAILIFQILTIALFSSATTTCYNIYMKYLDFFGLSVEFGIPSFENLLLPYLLWQKLTTHWRRALQSPKKKYFKNCWDSPSRATVPRCGPPKFKVKKIF